MRLPSATRRPLRVLRPLLAGLLAVVLLHAQGLGQWHRVAHAGLHGAQHAPSAAHDPFGHPADDTAECRLYDHLGAADGLLLTTAALCSEPAPPLVAPALPDGQAGRAAQPYQARAPPRA